MSAYTNCAANGCAAKVDRRYLMCRRHWARVPIAIQRLVYRHFRPGQLEDLRPSRPWYEAAADAVEAVARLEGRDETNTFRRIAQHMAERESRGDARPADFEEFESERFTLQ